MVFNPSRQKGITLIGFLLMFIFFGFYVLLGLKLAPIYLEYYKVKSSLASLKKEQGMAEKTPRDVLVFLQKRWDVNDINRITADKSVVVEKRQNTMKIQLDYEVEEPILGNVSALVKFKDSFTIGESN
jgi:hypothetical protein